MPELVLPLFPLPNVVHFPGTELPLHIFEPRYRQMVDELLALPGPERRVGMILTGEVETGSRLELLEPGCAGRLVAHEPLADGRSNIVLLGEFRFRIGREVTGRPYRRVTATPLEEWVPLIEAERAEELEREIVRLAAALARESGASFPADLGALAGLGRPGHLVPLVNRLAAGLDLPPLRKQTLLALEPLDRAGEIAGILRSRLKLLASLRPFRHLGSEPESN